MTQSQSIPALLNHLDAHRESATLSLAYASVGDEGTTEVAKFVRDNPFVKYLDMRGNNIQSKGIQALANGIKVNRSLRSLNLKWNSIGRDPSGIAALCGVLKSNLTIGHVDLRNNRINSAGAKSIGDMLTANTAITHLDLSWNDFGVDGGMALLDGLKHNSTVIDCQLSGSKCGEDTLHEVAFLLRRNRAAAAYKSSPDDTGAKVAAADPATSHIAGGGPAAATKGQSRDLPAAAGGAGDAAAGTEGQSASGKVSRAQWTAKDSSSLMLRLMMKEREQVLPEDKLFYQQVAEHIDKLLLETGKHKQGRLEGEEREKLSTTGFVEREQRYTKEIRQTEDSLQKSLADKENLQKELANKQAELKKLNEENAQGIRDSVYIQEQATVQEQELRKELRDTVTSKRDLQDKLNLNSKDLELLQQENERLRLHVKAFQRDVNEILA
mmetsp:Transcript_31744/g.95929  ORF Transcript_31744/g.95929 Transcript_31744/m.95929 type:complete len:440 (-) Transcript_31744:136-1455(-)